MALLYDPGTFMPRRPGGTVAAVKESMPSLIHIARDRAGVPADVSDLRVIDVVVWMIEHDDAAPAPAEEAP